MSELKAITREELQPILDAAVRRSDALKSGEALLEFNCVICKAAVDQKRATHGSDTCTNECSKEKSRRIRNWRASKSCRLCGRRARRPKTTEMVAGAIEMVSSLCAEAAHVGAE